MNGQDRPWWSSGSGPDAEVEPGPAAAERERRGTAGDGRDGRSTRPGAEGPRAGDHATDPSAQHDHDHEHHAHGSVPPLADGEVCQICPICTALRLVGEVRPDLLVHLSEAARHLTLAAKTIIDAQAAGYRGRGLEHIPLDDDPS